MDQGELELEEALDVSKPKFVKSFMGKSAVESSLSRVWNHLDSGKGFFVISTHLSGMSEEEELGRVRQLRNDLSGNLEVDRKPRLGYIPLRGKYTRGDTGEIEYEHSFFVPNNGAPDFKQMALELCKKYNQESVLFAEKGKVFFLYQNGQMEFVGNSIKNIEEINNYWAKLKKGAHSKFTFAFESLYPVNSLGLNVAHNWGEIL